MNYPPLTSIGSRIIYEESRFLVANKPANLLIHPTAPDGPNTLWHELVRLLAFELANNGKVALINRLDRETSGLVLVAKCSEAARILNLLMMQHQVRKLYKAIVFGWPAEDLFTVDQPLLRQGMARPSKIWLKQTIHPDGSAAVTHFRVLHRFSRGRKPFALIEAEPETGRTHQIRVHLAYVGNAIVGDKIYGPDEECYLDFIANDWTATLAETLLLPRHALHASDLSFQFAGTAFAFTAPLPNDLQQFLEGAD